MNSTPNIKTVTITTVENITVTLTLREAYLLWLYMGSLSRESIKEKLKYYVTNPPGLESEVPENLRVEMTEKEIEFLHSGAHDCLGRTLNQAIPLINN